MQYILSNLPIFVLYLILFLTEMKSFVAECWNHSFNSKLRHFQIRGDGDWRAHVRRVPMEKQFPTRLRNWKGTAQEVKAWFMILFILKIKFKIHLHEAICISHICLSRGYRESSIMQENLRRSLKNTSKDNLISAEDTCLGNYRLKFKGNF